MEDIYTAQALMYLLWVIFIALILAFIPANIAKNKGYSFGFWYIYGFLIWIVAFIHSLCLADKNIHKTVTYRRKKLARKKSKKNDELSKPDLLLKYKQLLDDGAITEDEYESEKKKILSK